MQCKERPTSDCPLTNCVLVHRSGRPHNCRKKPSPRKKASRSKERPPKKNPPANSSKKKKPPANSKKKKTPAIFSLKKKLWSAVKKHKSNCSDFSLKQRNGTCYLAAATLMFGRTAMDVCKVDDVRAYVRRSMGNAWDDAQGLDIPSQNTCPRIPRTIREYYAYLTKRRTFQSMMNRFTKVGARCVETKTCSGATVEPVNLIDGGEPDRFLVALMWASNIDCLYTNLYISLYPTKVLNPRGHAVLNFKYDYAMKKPHATFNQFAAKIVKTLPKTHPFHVLHFAMHGRNGYEAPQDSHKVLDVMNDLVDVAGANKMTIQGVGISIGNADGGHAVSVYPCYMGGTLKWVSCNSWGDDCSRGEFPDFIANLCTKLNYTHFLGLTFLIKISGAKK